MASTLAALCMGSADAASWTKLGGVPGGNFGRIALDPNNPLNVFVGAEGGGGIFKSIDGGLNYKLITVGTPQEAFRGVAVDPANSKILFAIGRDNASVQAYVYESTDGGNAWSRIAHQPGNGEVLYGWNLLFDKSGTTILTADSHYGVFRSTDTGKSWTQGISGTVKSLAADPNDPKTFWAGGYNGTQGLMGIWMTTDSGKTWTSLTAPNIGAGSTPIIFAIAVLPTSKIVLAAWGGFVGGNSVGGVIASKDGGKTWTNSSAGLPAVNFFPGDAIAADPTTPTTVYLTTDNLIDPASLYRSTDSGAHWSALGNVGGEGVYTVTARPAGHGLPAALLAAGSDLFQSTNSGKSWTRDSGGVATAFPLTAIDDQHGGKGLFADTYDGLFHSADGGQSWVRASTWKGNDTAPIAFDVDRVSATHDVYVATSSGFWRSADTGKSWTAIAFPGASATIAQVAADPVKGGRVYAYDSGNTLYRTDNGGTTWTKSQVGGKADAFTAYPALVFDPAKAGTIYAAVTSGLLKSVDAGATWTDTKVPGGAGGNINALAISGPAHGTLAAAVSGATAQTIQQSTDGGHTWHAGAAPFGSSGYVSQLIAQPKSQNLFAIGYGTAAESTNGGASWSAIDTSITSPAGFDNAAVTAGHFYLLGGTTNLGASYVTPVAAVP